MFYFLSRTIIFNYANSNLSTFCDLLNCKPTFSYELKLVYPPPLCVSHMTGRCVVQSLSSQFPKQAAPAICQVVTTHLQEAEVVKAAGHVHW